MKAHNQAATSVGKLAVLVAVLVVAAGMAGAFGDGKAPDLSKLGNLFEVHDQPAKKAKQPAESSEPPSITCTKDRQECWWTDLGRPSR